MKKYYFNTVTNQDGRDLHLYKLPSVKPIASILFVHGLGEHSGSYHELSLALQNKNIQTFGFDFIGHGKSYGQRGYVTGFETYLRDLEQVIKTLKAQEKGPLYLYAHSMGGLIALLAMEKDYNLDVEGIILSNPVLQFAFVPPKWKTKVADIALEFLPRLTLSQGIREEQLSSIPEKQLEMKKDEYRHKKISPRLYLDMVEGMEFIANRELSQTLKLSVYLSKQDTLCDYSFNKKYFETKNNAVTHTFEHSLHEIHNDVELDKLVDLILEFVR